MVNKGGSSVGPSRGPGEEIQGTRLISHYSFAQLRPPSALNASEPRGVIININNKN